MGQYFACVARALPGVRALGVVLDGLGRWATAAPERAWRDVISPEQTRALNAGVYA